MTFSRSKSLLIILSLISLVLMAVLILGVYTIRAKNEETSELLNLADEAANSEVAAQNIRQIQIEAASDIRAFNDLVLSDDRLVSLIESIESSARSLNLEADILSVDEAREGENGPRIVRFDIEGEGSWASTIAFLRVIESLPHKVMMERVTFSRAEEAWESRIAFALNLFE